jgi:hypothetical protein
LIFKDIKKIVRMNVHFEFVKIAECNVILRNREF